MSTRSSISENHSVRGNLKDSENKSAPIDVEHAEEPSEHQESPKRSFLGRIFGHRERDVVSDSLVTNEGTVTQHGWTGMGKDSPNSTRITTVKLLQQRVSPLQKAQFKLGQLFTPEKFKKQKKEKAQPTDKLPWILRMTEQSKMQLRNTTLQVSTLEGIWHETQDLLEDPELREPLLRAYIDVTRTQYNQIGLALRHTFFTAIVALGLSELTVKWLVELSAMGKDSSGFEPAMDDLMISWIVEVTTRRGTKADNEWKVTLLQMVKEYVRCNSAFVAEHKIADLVFVLTIRIVDKKCLFREHLFELMRGLLSYHEVLPESRSMNQMLIFSCILITVPELNLFAWKMAKTILTSHLNHACLKLMVDLMGAKKESKQVEGITEDTLLAMKKGIIIVITTLFWSRKPVSTQHYTWCPSIFLLAFERTVDDCPTLAREVLKSVEILMDRQGAEAAGTVWKFILNTTRAVLKLMTEREDYYNVCMPGIEGIAMVFDRLQKKNLTITSLENFFEMIYEYQDLLPLDSPAILSLIDFKLMALNPVDRGTSEEMTGIVTEYMMAKQGKLRRQRVIDTTHKLYQEGRETIETPVVKSMVMPLLSYASEIVDDPDMTHSLMQLLMDVIRNHSPRCEVEFCELLRQFGRMFRDSIKCNEKFLKYGPGEAPSKQKERNVSISISWDNMLDVLKEFDEIVVSKWRHLDLKAIRIISDILRRHLLAQYNYEWTSNFGSSTRTFCYKMLLSIQASPITSNIIYHHGRGAQPEVSNPFIKRRYISELGQGAVPINRFASESGWSWAEICDTCEMAIRVETWWPVIKLILKNIGRILELPETVRTSEETKFSELAHGLINLYRRRDQFRMKVDCGDDEDREMFMKKTIRKELGKYLPPVMSTLLNYTKRAENRHNIGAVIIECVKTGTTEAIAACDIALQLIPEIMCQSGQDVIDFLYTLPVLTVNRAIPLIELMSDAADTTLFHHFFVKDDFKKVIGMLTPYLDVTRFNPYIVAAVHRIIMRWFVQAPNKWRNELQALIEQQLDGIETSLKMRMLSNTTNRNPSGGDGRLGRDHFVIGETNDDEATPEPVDEEKQVHEHRTALKVIEDIKRALDIFFVSPEIIEVSGDFQLPETLYELTHECYSLGDSTIVSVKSFVQLEVEKIKEIERAKNADKVLREKMESTGFSLRRHSMVSRQGSLKNFAEYDGVPSGKREVENRDIRRMTFSAGTAIDKKELLMRSSVLQEKRRRYRTTIGAPRMSEGGLPDNIFSLRRGSASLDPVFDSPETETAGYLREQELVKQDLEDHPSFTLMTLRHMYGKSCWLMRSVDVFPVSFHKSPSIPVQASTLIQLIYGTFKAKKLGKPTNIVQLDRSLRLLDTMPASESHDVGVVYVAPFQTEETRILANTHGSRRYEAFLERLGEKITLEKCPGGLQEGIHGNYTYQYQDEMSTITYLIATFMLTDPEVDPQCNWKKKLIGNNFVTVVWNESGMPFKMNKFCKTFIKVAIELVPHDESHVLIQVHAKREVASCLAMRRSLIDDETISMFLRKLIVRTQLAVNVQQQGDKEEPFISRGVERLRKLRQTVDKFTETPLNITGPRQRVESCKFPI